MTQDKKYMEEVYGGLKYVKMIGSVSDLPLDICNSKQIGAHGDILKNKDNYIFMMLRKENNIGMMYISIEQAQNLFTNISVSNGEVHIMTSDNKFSFVLDPDSSLGQKFFNDVTLRQLKATMEMKVDIPLEHRGKCCIYFANKILESTDTVEQAKELAKTKYLNLQVKILIPPSNPISAKVASFTGENFHV